MANGETTNGRGLFEALARLFSRNESAPARPKDEAKLAKIESEFSAALGQLDRKIDTLRREQALASGEAKVDPTALAAAKQARLEQIHARAQADILATHARLGTEIDAEQLSMLTRFLEECARQSESESTRELLPCCRSSILRRLHREAGPIAWQELEKFLAAADEAWPLAVQRDRLEDDAAFAHRLQVKYREAAADFADYTIDRSAELIRGVERAWKSDYPEPGTPLWQELIMEGVATGLRARIFHDYVGRLRRHQEEIVARAGELVGRELAELHRVLSEQGPGTLEDAYRAASSSSRIIDEVIPDLAWAIVNGKQEG